MILSNTFKNMNNDPKDEIIPLYWRYRGRYRKGKHTALCNMNECEKLDMCFDRS